MVNEKLRQKKMERRRIRRKNKKKSMRRHEFLFHGNGLVLKRKRLRRGWSKSQSELWTKSVMKRIFQFDWKGFAGKFNKFIKGVFNGKIHGLYWD